ncbi:TonB-dependent receptor [Qipengyuania sp. YIM B01966]|uniref:TonB-dependent receptor n=1 Tax=Qipengyuania sp. YIM B01966 TaxID=2778646 RepID=UPI0018F3E248|nr:TonB-dependent receptor [Qipengyuania sp. YIM B01966]
MSYHSTRFTRPVRLLAGGSLAALAFAASPALAQSAAPADDLHDRRVDTEGEIVVTATGLEQLDIIAGTSVVEAAELQREMHGQIGEVLAKQPGVSATSFSPGASRPVLRGFSGERVKVLVDGIGAIDASNTSADHAVSIDPLTAERIEVLRGPAVMLYGGQAIGGAINVIDKRIPLRRLNEPVHFDLIAGADSAADLRQAGASVDLPLGRQFVVHLDGAWRKTDDLAIGGKLLAPALRAEVLANAAEELAEGHADEAGELTELANARGTLPNSATETWSANAGFAFFAGGGSLGASFGVYDTAYGIPLRPGAGHHHEGGGEEEHGEENVTIGLRQYRADLRGVLPLGDGLFHRLKTRVGFSDYTHTEFEGDEIGTVFDVKGIEARAELEQNVRGTWRGASGIQYYTRDFAATGAEAFIAPNDTRQLSLFTLQEVGFGPWQLELGGRWERADIRSVPTGFDRSFDSVSGAASLAYQVPGGLRVGISASRSERAPAAEELLSNGPHIATQAFEVGDLGLDTERALGLEGFVRGKAGPATVSLALFRNWFADYIYLAATGAEEDGLPVFQYRQGDADYLGVEGEVSLPLGQMGPISLLADLRGDYVRASLADGSPLPRIPPLSLLGALEAQSEVVDGRVEVQWFDAQNRVAEYETPTDGFTLVNASLSFKPWPGSNNLTLVAAVDNIFDVDARRHASFTKDFAPLAGRNFRISARASF